MTGRTLAKTKNVRGGQLHGGKGEGTGAALPLPRWLRPWKLRYTLFYLCAGLFIENVSNIISISVTILFDTLMYFRFNYVTVLGC